MASGWTNSGIDWTSVSTMRESRTEDIVREIYLAVNEREYWMHTFTQAPSSRVTAPVLDRAGRIRMIEAYNYIYNTIKKWLTPFSDLSLGGNNFAYYSTSSCFINPNSSMNVYEKYLQNFDPFQPQGRWFGLENYDYSQSGDFENDTGMDLSVFRSALNYKRVDFDFLKLAYDILNTPLKSANVYSGKNAFNGVNFAPDTHYNRGNYKEANTSGFFGFSYREQVTYNWGTGDQQTGLDTFIDNVNANTTTTKLTTARYDSVQDIDRAIIQASFQYIDSYIAFLHSGYNNQPMDMDDASIEVFSYGYRQKRSSAIFENLMPNGDRSIGVNSSSPSIVTLEGQEVFRVSAELQKPLPYITSLVTAQPYPESKFKDSAIVFMDIAKPTGFLNYYTEP